MIAVIDKENIADELKISVATFNNRIKTGIIPPAEFETHYARGTYLSWKTLDQVQQRLGVRANRTSA